MAYVIELTKAKWKLVADLFDPPGRRGAPAQIPRRQMNAILFLARTGCQWRYLLDPQASGRCRLRKATVRSKARSAAAGTYASRDGSANQCPVPG